MSERQKKLAPYVQALPGILQYQLFTKLVLGVWLFLMGRIFRMLLNSTNRVAVSSGDILFLITSWQGLLILLCALVSLLGYFAIDINAKVVLSKDLLSGDRIYTLRVLKRALPTIRHFACPAGLGVILYIMLIAPILGMGVSLSMTKGFYIPTFISSVINDTPIFVILFTLLMVVFLSVGIANLFIIHAVVLDGLTVKEASARSKKLMAKNWKDYLKQNVLFVLVLGVILVTVIVVLLVLPLALIQIIPFSAAVRRVLTVFFVTSGVLLSLLIGLLATPLYMMKMTQLYYLYKGEEPVPFHPWKKNNPKYTAMLIVVWILAVGAATVLMTRRFDTLFPQESTVRIIAHRGGGTEAPENTAAGIEKAWEIGSFGSEIDIQRTKDGFYILNHDGDFQRVAGVKRKPEDMTLAEIKELSIEGEPVATLEEALEATRGKGILFIELKGSTADRQMAHDTVKTVKEHGMEDECVLIGLKYELIEYIETTYPEIQTGYLTFASFGDTAKLNCDYLAMEEESATAEVISEIHKQGKKVLVWTSNGKRAQKHFLCSKIDGLITDNASQALELIQELRGRKDLRRMADRLLELLS